MSNNNGYSDTNKKIIRVLGSAVLAAAGIVLDSFLKDKSNKSKK